MLKKITTGITAAAAALCLMGTPVSAQNTAGSHPVPPMPEALQHMTIQKSAALSTSMSASTLLPATPAGTVPIDGENVPFYVSPPSELGLLLPDGQGGLVWQQSGLPRVLPDAETIDARELKLKIRELAEQLISGVRDRSLRNVVALPTTFVDQDNFKRTSSFGRYIVEQLFYEFNQRGFPIREYRLNNAIHTEPQQGSFLLSRELADIPVGNTVAIVGTYYQDRSNVFVNARLIRGSDGRVLRSGQLVIPLTGVTRRMLARTNRTIPNATIGIRDYKDTTIPAGDSVLDRGYDLH